MIEAARLARRSLLAGAGAAVLAIAFGPAAHAQDADRFRGQTLNVLGWADHVGEDVLGPFKEQYGVNINVKEYELTANALATVGASAPDAFDVVVLDTVAVPLFVNNGYLAPLDTTRFDLSSIRERFVSEPNVHIDGAVYAIPSKYGYNAIAYNTDHVDPADMQSYAVLWSEKYAGRVGVLFDPQNNIQSLSLYLGYPPGPLSDEQLEKVKEVLLSIKNNDLKVVGDIATVQQALANESAYIIANAAEWAVAGLITDGLPVAWTIPKEGATLWTESVAITAGTKNKELAELLLQYYLSPEGQARLATSAAYWGIPTNAAAGEILSEQQRAVLNWDEQETLLSLAKPLVQIPSADLEKWTDLVRSTLIAE